MTCDLCDSDDDVEIILGTTLCAECREQHIAIAFFPGLD